MALEMWLRRYLSTATSTAKKQRCTCQVLDTMYRAGSARWAEHLERDGISGYVASDHLSV